MIEALEARIAPAAAVPFIDVDGDKVMVVTSKGTNAQLTGALKLVDSGSGEQLREIDFSTVPLVGGVNPFVGTDLRVFVTEKAPLGDGRVNVGYIDASASDSAMTDGAAIALGKVFVAGDVGQLDVGAGINATAFKSFTALSVGALGISTQAPSGSTASQILGKVGTLKVTAGISSARLVFTSAVTSITVGGSMSFSAIEGIGTIGKVTINGALFGLSSRVEAASLASLNIGGGMPLGGSVSVTGLLGTAKFGASVLGGVISAVDITKLTVNGSLEALEGSGGGTITASNNLGTITILGDLEGALVSNSGSIKALQNIGSVRILGSVLGGAVSGSNEGVNRSGIIEALGNISSVKIGGDLRGSVTTGTASLTGAVICSGDLGTLSIGGSIVGAGQDETFYGTSAMIAADHIGTITVRGNMSGNGSTFAKIYAEGGDAKAAIGKLTVKGDTFLALIRAGSDPVNGGRNLDARVDSISIGGNFASSYVEIALPGSGATDDVNQTARLGSIRIGGTVSGNGQVVAEHIVAASLGKSAIKVTPDARNDLSGYIFPFSTTVLKEIL